MPEIRALKTPRVGEDRSGLLEGDLVLEQVRRSLRAIPLEHALSIYETTHQESGACDAGAAPGRDASRLGRRLRGSAAQRTDRRLRECEHPCRLVVGPLAVGGRVLLRGNEVYVAVEREFTLPAEALGDLSRPRELLPNAWRKLEPMFDQEAADIVELRGLDADCAEHPLERQFDELLRLPDDVRVCPFVPQDGEGLEPLLGPDEVGAGEALVRYNLNTSPGLRSGLSSQYQPPP